MFFGGFEQKQNNESYKGGFFPARCVYNTAPVSQMSAQCFEQAGFRSG